LDPEPAATGSRSGIEFSSGKNMSSPSNLAQHQSFAGVRLQKHADYQRAYALSRKRQSSSLSWFLAIRPPDSPIEPKRTRVGLTVGKVIGKAHERNRIKRRMRDIVRRHLNLLPAGCDLILHPRRTVLTIEFTKLEAELVRILKQAQSDAQKHAPRE
jgi:ribonuclease P protein component